MNLSDFVGGATVYDKKLMLERKEPISWLKSVSAFANTNGGVLVYGVADEKRGIVVKPTFRSTATGFFAILPNLNKGFSMTVKGGKTVTETTLETTPETTLETTSNETVRKSTGTVIVFRKI